MYAASGHGITQTYIITFGKILYPFKSYHTVKILHIPGQKIIT